jgi:hypothetical protein
MSDESTNSQYSSPPFGISQGVASTNAPGTEGISASTSAPALQSGVVVSVPGQSSQVEPDRATVSLGDTLGMASDSVVPRDTGDPLSGLSWNQVSETGAGMGHTMTRHPGSTARPA